MGISRWGSRVEQKLSGPYAITPEMSPGETVSAVARNSEINQINDLIREAMEIRITKRLRGSLVQMTYDAMNDWYKVTVRVVHDGKPAVVHWQVRSEDVEEASAAKRSWNSYMDSTADSLLRQLELQGIGTGYLRDGLAKGSQASLTNSAFANQMNALGRAAGKTASSMQQAAASMQASLPPSMPLWPPGQRPNRIFKDEADRMPNPPSRAEEKAAIDSIVESAKRLR